MADEAFALSPISARAAQPSEADYAAISEAFMETSRGRWFLSEYAKRNRNADTSMVLDAVARIEENLTEQSHTLSEGGLSEALASIRRALDEARTAALHAIDGRAFVETVGPIRKGTRIIREIAWRLREIGADGRICDLIASQVEIIEAACAEIASIDSGDALNSAFNLIEDRIKQFDGGETAPLQKGDQSVAAQEAVVVAKQDIVPEPVVLPQPAEQAMTEADIMHDDAVLDQVAMEMGAPDPDPEPSISEMIAATPAPAKTETVTQSITPATIAPPTPLSVAPPQTPLPEPSLGESLIANGIVRRPVPSIADPFAAIRRLSQAEKIAFFS